MSDRTGLFSYRSLDQAFRELSIELAQHDLHAHIYVVGGAAMIMAYDFQRRTMDVDGLVTGESQSVLALADQMGDRHGWTKGWLNEKVRLALPEKEDDRAVVVYEDRHLVITAASPKHLLAMKVRAAREKDFDDIRFLARHLDLGSIREVWDIHDEVFGANWPVQVKFEMANVVLGERPDDRSMEGDDRYAYGFEVERKLHGPTRLESGSIFSV